jgi:hypothetical protein
VPTKSKTRFPQRTSARHRPRARVSDTQREQLLLRLFRLNERTKTRQGYRTAIRLLKQRYDLASPKAKAEILKAASFMIWILERTLTGN